MMAFVQSPVKAIQKARKSKFCDKTAYIGGSSFRRRPWPFVERSLNIWHPGGTSCEYIPNKSGWQLANITLAQQDQMYRIHAADSDRLIIEDKNGGKRSFYRYIRTGCTRLTFAFLRGFRHNLKIQPANFFWKRRRPHAKTNNNSVHKLLWHGLLIGKTWKRLFHHSSRNLGPIKEWFEFSPSSV